ncbi:MAG: phosphodiester glycosidase family protein [Verrucomicrobiaceae bacterium]
MPLLRVILTFLVTSLPLLADYGKADLPLGPNASQGTLHYFQFSTETHDLRIIDQGKGAPRFANLAAAMQANKCEAGCNGSFFHPNGTPLGLVIANGRMEGKSNPDSSLTSGTFYSENGSIRLVRTSVFAAKKLPLPRNVLQTGPFLIEGGKGVTGLSDRRFARRTILATDGRGNWIIGYASPTTLIQLSQALLKKGSIPGFTISHAINLDGGSSSGLWIQRDNNPLYFREVSKVRNFVGIVPK